MSLFPEDRPRCPEHGKPLPCSTCAEEAAREDRLGSVTHARKMLFAPETFKEGSICPCCDRTVTLRRRLLNAGMARMLIWIVCTARATGEEWLHPGRAAPQRITRSHDWYYLAAWKLAELKPGDTNKGTKKTSGWWRPTQRGIDFVDRRITVPTHAFTFNRKCYGHDVEEHTIIQALGKEFSYRELMDAWGKGVEDDGPEE